MDLKFLFFQASTIKSAPKPDPVEKDNSDSDKQEDKQNAPVFDELGGNLDYITNLF